MSTHSFVYLSKIDKYFSLKSPFIQLVESFIFTVGTYPLGEAGDVLVEGLGGEDVGSGGVGAGLGVAWRAGGELAFLEDQVQQRVQVVSVEKNRKVSTLVLLVQFCVK